MKQHPVPDDSLEPEGGTRFSVVVKDSAVGERLDRHLPEALAEAGRTESRAALQELIREGAVRLNGRQVKPRHTLAAGDRIEVTFPVLRAETWVPEVMDLVLLYEDEELVVVDKPAGLVVHPGSGHDTGTLVHGLLHRCEGRLYAGAGDDRPGIVHRLDKDTSGCLVVAKTEVAYHSLVAQFAGRETEKRYRAVTEGVPLEVSGHLATQIGRHPHHRQKMAVRPDGEGKLALTDYEVVRADPDGHWASLLCVIHTGRTHQIRVHLKECLRCPILGDVIYAQPNRQATKVTRLMLHAERLAFRHPVSGDRLEFHAPMPPEFAPFL